MREAAKGWRRSRQSLFAFALVLLAGALYPALACALPAFAR